MKIVFDGHAKRPASPQLQGLYGGDPLLAKQFPEGTWLTKPTRYLLPYDVTQEQLDRLIEVSKWYNHRIVT